MFGAAPVAGVQLAYRGPQDIDAGQRGMALGVVLALHAAVIGAFVIAQLHPPTPPPETVLTVSLISDVATAAPAPPSPPQPTPPPLEQQVIASARPTPSPMTAPPLPETTRDVLVAPPAPPAPPAPAAPASAAPGPPSTTPPNFTAAYLNNPGPAYPMAARRLHWEGTTRLRVQVGPDGAPLQVLLDRSSGHKELDQAALDVVQKRWKFAPAKQGDRAVAAWVIVPLEFSLKS